MNKKSNQSLYAIIAHNRKARFNYEILDTLEAGLVLLGSEVKSLRKGNISIQEGYIEVKNTELYLTNTHIGEYNIFGKNSHPALRNRKLLLHKKQIEKLREKVKLKGITLVPLKLYFNSKGIAKLELGVAKGKTLYDKRNVIKERAAKKEADVALKNYRKTTL